METIKENLDKFFKIRENLQKEYIDKLNELDQNIESITNNTFNYKGKYLKLNNNTYIYVHSYTIRRGNIDSYNTTEFDFYGLSFSYEIGYYPESNWCKWDLDSFKSCSLDDIINNVVEISESEFNNAFNDMLKLIKDKHYSVINNNLKIEK